AKEMDDGKTVSVSRIYVPHEYSGYLAPDDRNQFESYEESLVDELQQYLAEHARREQYAPMSAPRLVFTTDADLAAGASGVTTPRGGAPGGNRVLDRRPRLDERARTERASHPAGEARPRRHDHDRLDRDLVSSRRSVMLASVEVQTVLLILKVCFLVLLYLFIWRIVRSASRDVRLPQESFILAPSQAASLGLGRQQPDVTMGALVTLKSNALEEGARFDLNGRTLTVGRSASNDIRLDGDEFASAHHARIEPRRD